MIHELSTVLENIRVMAAADDLAAVIVHLNDTYVIEESKHGLPGMARVATVVDQVRGEVFRATGKQRTLVVHSGDFMMPSRRGRETNGEAMTKMLGQFVDVLTLGNHEFDLGPAALADRIRDLATQRVRIVCTNVAFPHKGVLTEQIVYWPSENDPLFAVVGVMGSNVFPDGKEWTGTSFEHPDETIRSLISKGLRGARRLIVLSHDDREEDLKMLTALDGALTARPGFGYLLGGHDHEIDWSQRYVGPSMGRTVFSKCRSNAKSLRFFLVSRSQLIVDELRRLIVHPNPTTMASVRENLAPSEHLGEKAVAIRAALDGHDPYAVRGVLSQTEIGCDVGIRLGFDGMLGVMPAQEHTALASCLAGIPSADKVLLSRAELIDITDAATRARPTPFGRFVTRCVRTGTEAAIAIIHAGSFRGDDMMGPNLDNRLLDNVFIYDDASSIVVASLKPKALRAVLEHGRAKESKGTGRFAQTSEDEDDEHRLLSGDQPVRVAIASYLLRKDKDGYRAILESHITGFQEECDQWLKQRTWSIKDLVERNWEKHRVVLEELSTTRKPSGGGGSAEVLSSFSEASAQVQKYLVEQGQGFRALQRAFERRNYDSTVQWRELDTYATHPIVDEDHLANLCPPLLDWWGRTHESWVRQGMEPYFELQTLRGFADKKDSVLGEIAEALAHYAEGRRDRLVGQRPSR